ncbi:MAG: acyl-CoA carboxylase subunit epsilon [Actinomycetales bacterium]|nr:acyl-CoA carboxylase subunit epsilon [Actinomycetales bacterium]
MLRVVHGELPPEHLAALVAVVAARASGGGAVERPAPRSEWGHPARAHRAPHRVGPGQWRASAW